MVLMYYYLINYNVFYKLNEIKMEAFMVDSDNNPDLQPYKTYYWTTNKDSCNRLVTTAWRH